MIGERGTSGNALAGVGGFGLALVLGGAYAALDALLRAPPVYGTLARAVTPLARFVNTSDECVEWSDTPPWLSALPARFDAALVDDAGARHGWAELLLVHAGRSDVWYMYAIVCAAGAASLTIVYACFGIGPAPARDGSGPLRYSSLWVRSTIAAAAFGLLVPGARLVDGAWHALFCGAAARGGLPWIAVDGWLAEGPLAAAMLLVGCLCARTILAHARSAGQQTATPPAPHRVYRDAANRCHACRYEAPPTGPCPECGTPTPHDAGGVFLTRGHALFVARFGPRAPRYAALACAALLAALPLWGACIAHLVRR